MRYILRLTFDNQYRSISNFYPEGTIVSTGLSKWCGAGGWRLGFFAIPNQLKDLKNSLKNIVQRVFYFCECTHSICCN